MKNKILPICLQGNYRDSLGEFSDTLNGAFGAERVNEQQETQHLTVNWYIKKLNLVSKPKPNHKMLTPQYSGTSI